ncbi:TetR/AcrR family transcriptional regulator [Streptomyces sp. NPDC102274]|uniref:TetR/AcrR family transcriptional regulator n=1 Tax=Streptomyces sp. NPDC102274 TaxID=3366151 RepID=UPI0037FF296B
MATEDNEDAGRRYHHGDLPAALIRTSFELLADNGLADFSVAKVARRLGISTAAPYRHYSDRDHLLAAVAAAAARQLAAAVRAAAEGAGPDPADRFGAAGAAYVRFAVSHGAGFDVIYAAGPRGLGDAALAAAGRELMDLLTTLAEDTGVRPKEDALRLVGDLVALAHGYATLYRDGFFPRARYSLDDIAAHAARAGRELAAGR